jgi:hypothetical protein
MKRVMAVACVMLATMAVSMMSGCAGQKPIDASVFFVSSDAGASKQPISLGESTNGGFNPSSTEGASKPGISLGESTNGGFNPSSTEGASKPGIKF